MLGCMFGCGGWFVCSGEGCGQQRTTDSCIREGCPDSQLLVWMWLEKGVVMQVVCSGEECVWSVDWCDWWIVRYEEGCLVGGLSGCGCLTVSAHLAKFFSPKRFLVEQDPAPLMNTSYCENCQSLVSTAFSTKLLPTDTSCGEGREPW